MGFLSGLVDKLKGANKTPGAYFAAIGKHPGWNDHMDDQGLETPLLIDFRRFFYVQGMCGVIDSGAWESLDPDQRLNSFNHLLLCKRGASLLLAKLWSSSDGKGRSKYPFVAIAQTDNMPVSWLLENAAPLLDSLHTSASNTKNSNDVVAAVNSMRQTLRQNLPPAAPVAPPPLSPLKELETRFDMGHSALRILLYHTQREFASFIKGNRASSSATPRQMRVPRCADSAITSLGIWSRYLDSFIDDSVMTLAIAPVEHPWVDLLTAEPTPALLSCIRYSLAAMPLSTGIPYNLDPDFIASADRMIG